MNDKDLLGMLESIEHAIGGKDARFDVETGDLVLEFGASHSDQPAIDILGVTIVPGDVINLYHLGAGGSKTYIRGNNRLLGYKKYPEGWKNIPEIWYQLSLVSMDSGDFIIHPAGPAPGRRAIHIEIVNKSY